MSGRGAVRERREREAVRGLEPGVAALAERVAARLSPHTVGVLYYGSCRRSGATPDAVVDLHVVVDDLAGALGSLPGMLAAALPPNVYYLEADTPGGRLRTKYAVLSEREFRRASMGGRWHSYFWARYAQPVSIAWARGAAERAALLEALVEAGYTFVARSVALQEARFGTLAVFERGLGRAYAAELRAEGGHRPVELVAVDADYYEALAAAILPDVGARLGPDGCWTRCLRRPRVWSGRMSWWLRVVLGKPLSLARLLKALATFDGGIDYLIWKLERHSGRGIEVPERVRRRPLVHLWPLMWRLWREGVFR